MHNYNVLRDLVSVIALSDITFQPCLLCMIGSSGKEYTTSPLLQCSKINGEQNGNSESR
jgi:hypothetical protein